MVAHSTNHDWLSKVQEDVLEPDLPICDPHHHLWDRKGGVRRAICSTRSWRTPAPVTTSSPPCSSSAARCSRPTGRRLSLRRRDRVRERHRGDERLRPLRQDARRRRHRRHRRPAPGRRRGRRARRADRRRRRPLPRHPPRRGLGRRSPPCPNHRTNPPRGPARCATTSAPASRTWRRAGSRFEAWCYHPQIPDVTALARAFPDTTIILDHFGGPLGVGPYAGKRERGLRGVARAHHRAGDAARTSWPSSAGINMEINGFGWHERPAAAVQPGAGRRDAALLRVHHREVRRRPLHVRVELPGRQGELQLHGAVELVQAPDARATRPPRRPSSSTTPRRASIACRLNARRASIPATTSPMASAAVSPGLSMP